ncbi:MAG: BlaI/MecI/CopY family transcriptional regulator [Oscillospiraceae bacterium]|nr:BlaI/MecI/CopY family transcriptional regulator [Oscillospiraceae bacterium]
MELTKSELEIMNVLWDAGRPLTRGEILELSVDKKWKDNSIHILLNRLLAKGAIAEGGFTRSGKSYGRLYEPQITGEDYYAASVFAVPPARLDMLFDAMLRSTSVDLALLELFAAKLKKKQHALSE